MNLETEVTNKITLCTIILPRLEVFFIEDWINHNLSLKS